MASAGGILLSDSTPTWEQQLNAQKSDLNLAHAIQILSLAGLVVLVRDCVKSFTQERDFVWSKPSSFTKYTFLLNRYLVPVCFFVLFISFSGFKGLNFSDSACHWIISIITAMHPCSLALGNILMIARVVNLWDHNQTILKVLSAAFVLAFAATMVLVILGLQATKSGMVFNPLLRMCTSTASSRFLIAATVVPMTFELLVLALIYWNTLDRPRAQNTSWHKVLVKDGVSFFLYTAIFRILQVALVSLQLPGVTSVGVMFEWAGVYLVLYRHLISLYKAGLEASLQFRSAPRARMQARHPALDTRAARSATEWDVGESIELGQVAVETFRSDR